MELAGFDAHDPIIQRVIRAAGDDAVVLEEVPVWMVFTPGEAELEFVGDRHVPQIRMSGDMSRVIPQVSMPFDITTVDFEGRRGLHKTADYMFTTDQLQSLVGKGLYHTGFEMDSEKLTGSVLAVPTTASMVILRPDVPEAPPLVSVDVDLEPSFEMSQASTGYDLAAEVFPDYRAELLENGMMTPENEAGLQTVREDQYTDLFAGDETPDYNSELYARGPGALAADDAQRNEALEALTGRRLVAAEALDGLDDPADGAAGVAARFAGSLGGSFGREASDFFQKEIVDQRERMVRERDERMGNTRVDRDSFDELEGVDLDTLDLDDDGDDVDTTGGQSETEGGYAVVTDSGMVDFGDEVDSDAPDAPEVDEAADPEREDQETAEDMADLFAVPESQGQQADAPEQTSSEGEYSEESNDALSEQEKNRRRAENARRAAARRQQASRDNAGATGPDVDGVAPRKDGAERLTENRRSGGRGDDDKGMEL